MAEFDDLVVPDLSSEEVATTPTTRRERYLAGFHLSGIEGNAWGTRDEVIVGALEGIVDGAMGPGSYKDSGFVYHPGTDGEEAAYRYWSKRIRTITAEDPERYGHLPQTVEDMRMAINIRLQDEVGELQWVLNRAPQDAFGMETAGRIARGATDEVGLASAALSFGLGGLSVGFARTVAMEAGIGALDAAARIPTTTDTARRLNQEPAGALSQIAAGAIGGAVISGGAYVGGAGARYAWDRIRAGDLELTPGTPLDHVTQAGTEAHIERGFALGRLEDVPDTTDEALKAARLKVDAVQIEYDLAGKIRNKKPASWIEPAIRRAVAPLGDNIGVRVTSAGQAPKGTPGARRTGSTRHDHGNAVDLVLTRNGRPVLPSEDKALYMRFFQLAARDFPGIGHYSWGVHVGGGKRASWGPDRTSRTLDPDFSRAIKDGRAGRAPDASLAAPAAQRGSDSVDYELNQPSGFESTLGDIRRASGTDGSSTATVRTIPSREVEAPIVEAGVPQDSLRNIWRAVDGVKRELGVIPGPRFDNSINPSRPPIVEPPRQPAELPRTEPTQGAGGAGAAQDIGRATEATAQAAKPRAPRVSRPVQKRPTSLKQFVVDRGGYFAGDDRGDLAALEWRKPGFKRKEKFQQSAAGNNGGGHTIDDLRLFAVEAGYLPETSDINDFINALSDDITGARRVYSNRDADSVEAWRAYDGAKEYADRYQSGDLPDAPEVDILTNKPFQEGDGFLVDLQKYYDDANYFDPDYDPNQAIALDVRNYLDREGHTQNLSDTEIDEIIATAQNDGGDVAYMVERAYTREVEYFDEYPDEAIPNDIPFPDDDFTAQGALGPDAGNAGQPEGNQGATLGGAEGAEGLDLALRPVLPDPRAPRDSTAATRAADEFIDDLKADLGLDEPAPRTGMSERDRAEIEARQRQSRLGRLDQERVEDDADGLFAVEQYDIFDDSPTGKALTVRDAIADLDADADFLDQLDLCNNGR